MRKNERDFAAQVEWAEIHYKKTTVIPTLEDKQKADDNIQAHITQTIEKYPKVFAGQKQETKETKWERLCRERQEQKDKTEQEREERREQLSHSKERGKGLPKLWDLEGSKGVHMMMQKRRPNRIEAPILTYKIDLQQQQDHDKMFPPNNDGWGEFRNLTRAQLCFLASHRNITPNITPEEFNSIMENLEEENRNK